MADPSGDVSTASTLDHFPLPELPEKALKRVFSYLSLPLRSAIRFNKRLRDIEAIAPQHIHSIKLVFCEEDFVLLVTESKSEEERIMRRGQERIANGEFEGVTMASILKEDDGDEPVDFDYSKYSYGICFNSEERISILHDFLKRLAGASIHRFELDTWVSPYFYDDILQDILPLLTIEQLTLNSTTERKSLFDTMQVDKGVAVGYECASKHHDNRVMTDEFLEAFVFDKDVFHSYILHLEVTAKALHEVYTVMAEGECSLGDFLIFVKVSQLREMRKLMGVTAGKEGYKTAHENMEMFKSPGSLHFLIGPIHILLGSYFAKNLDNYGAVQIERVKNWEKFNEDKETWDKVQFV